MKTKSKSTSLKTSQSSSRLMNLRLTGPSIMMRKIPWQLLQRPSCYSLWLNRLKKTTLNWPILYRKRVGWSRISKMKRDKMDRLMK